ncbi:hypothetical protein R0J87_12635 [Halomonas sp. SIMBA_159]
MLELMLNQQRCIPEIERGIKTKDADKFCSGCQEYYPADTEFFYRDRREADGLRSKCKACYSELPSVQKRQAKGGA